MAHARLWHQRRVPAGGCDLAVLVSQPSIRSKASQSRIGAYPPIGFYLLKTEGRTHSLMPRYTLTIGFLTPRRMIVPPAGKQRSLVIKREDMLAGTVFRKGRESTAPQRADVLDPPPV